LASFTDYLLIGLSLLLLLSILASKISDRYGIPALLLFLAVGMLAGSDGPGGIAFDDASVAQTIGIVALAFILFSGGLDTEWKSIRPVLAQGLALSTAGVILTALILGALASLVLGFTLLEGLLLGAIVSSTDAAAVFSILRSKGIHLRGRLAPLLELESGSNDPMAVFLTSGLIQLLTQPEASPAGLLGLFVLQFAIGGLAGYALGRGLVWLVNRLRLGYEGLYPALTLALVLFIYGFTNFLGGNGFLAVYVAGIVAGNRDFIHKRSLLSFHDGLAWLMQIVLFLTLGLLVFPSRLVLVAAPSLAMAAALILVARPVAVLLTLLPTRIDLREKVYVAWVGLRGAVPIVLATYPLLANLPQAQMIFNIVFFVVLTSVLLQGTTVPLAARWLKVDAPPPAPVSTLPHDAAHTLRDDLKEVLVSPSSPAVGRKIVELGLPPGFLIVLIARDDAFVQPTGATTLLAGDRLLALADLGSLAETEAALQVGR
jgi:cell volume regulation protein A